MLFPRVIELLAAQHGEAPADAAASRMGHDHVVDEAPGAGDEGVGELGPVFLRPPGDLLRCATVGTEDDLHRPLGSHDRDLRRRPGVVHVAAQVLGTHDVVSPAIGLAGDHRHLGYRRLAIGKEQLGTMLDDGAMLLGRARQKSGHVDEGHDRDIEAVAKAHEAGGLARGIDVEAPARTMG